MASSSKPNPFVYVLAGVFALLIVANLVSDWLIRVRTRKLVINAAKSSEIVTSMFPEQVRDKLLNDTKVNKKASRDKNRDEQPTAAFVDLYPNTTVLVRTFVGFDGCFSFGSSHLTFHLFAVC